MLPINVVRETIAGRNKIRNLLCGIHSKNGANGKKKITNKRTWTCNTHQNYSVASLGRSVRGTIYGNCIYSVSGCSLVQSLP